MTDSPGRQHVIVASSSHRPRTSRPTESGSALSQSQKELAHVLATCTVCCMATQPTHTRKVNAKDYGLRGRWATVQVLPSTGGNRTRRGLTGSKRGWGVQRPRTARRAPRQGGSRMGNAPVLSATNWSRV